MIEIGDRVTWLTIPSYIGTVLSVEGDMLVVKWDHLIGTHMNETGRHVLYSKNEDLPFGMDE